MDASLGDQGNLPIIFLLWLKLDLDDPIYFNNGIRAY